jgi:4-hydroxybenzoate polyprenyltransferase
MTASLQALRAHHWIKNLLVFLPMLLAHQFGVQAAWQSLLAFVAFSLVASSVYVFNDLSDLESDRAHAHKRNRPFASRRLGVGHGMLLGLLLVVGGLLVAFTLGNRFALVMSGYWAAAMGYSLYLKRILVIDICMLSVFYTLRLIAGGVATGIPLSIWLLAFSIFFFFALASLKRQAELFDIAKAGKEKIDGRGYHAGDLPLVANMTISSGYISVLVMALYLNSPMVQKLYTRPSFLWGICIVLLYWVSRIAIITNQGKMHDDPLIFAVKDRISQICLLTMFGFAVGAALL